MKHVFWGGYCLLLLLAATVGYGFGHEPGLTSEGCAANSGCMKCVMNSCQPLTENQTMHYAGTDQVERCVEYDHIVPSHCATFTRTHYEIREGMFVVAYCYSIPCCHGTPTAEECQYAEECFW
jgi:hypothetical protein